MVYKIHFLAEREMGDDKIGAELKVRALLGDLLGFGLIAGHPPCQYG